MAIQDQIGAASGNASPLPALLSVDEFRRLYFSQQHRPSRATVRTWIAVGTSDGIVLPGYRIEQKYFVDRERIDEFFEAYRRHTNSRTASPRSSAKLRARRALGELKKEFQIG